MTCVLDASVALSLVLEDEFTAVSEKVISMVSTEGAYVPALWDFEVLNGLRSAERRGRLTAAAVAAAAQGLSRLPINVDPHRPDALRISDLAREYELTAYDASYLALAMDRGLPLATLDSTLAQAAARAGVALVEP